MPTWDEFCESFNDLYQNIVVPDDAYLNAYFMQGIERIRVSEVRHGHGDVVLILGYNADEEKPSSVVTNLSLLTLTLKTEGRAGFEERGITPEPPKISPRIEGFRPSTQNP